MRSQRALRLRATFEVGKAYRKHMLLYYCNVFCDVLWRYAPFRAPPVVLIRLDRASRRVMAEYWQTLRNVGVTTIENGHCQNAMQQFS